MARKLLLVIPALLALWIGIDLAAPRHSSLTRFDGHEVGKLETEMWRAYYGRHSMRLFTELVQLLRDQYHLPFWRARLAGFHAARAAIVFQRGHNQVEYRRALPDLIAYYAIIRRSVDQPFPVETAARQELAWWIVHRERASHSPADLEQALAALQATIYQIPESAFRDHARDRARAMLLRDAAADAGGVSEKNWRTIGALLDSSWVELEEAVTRRQ